MRFIDHLIPPPYHADADVLRRVRLWVVISIIFIISSVLAVTEAFALGISSMVVALTIGGVVSFFLLMLLRMGVPFLVLVHLATVNAASNFTFGMFTTGGIESNATFWILTLPLSVLMVSDKRQALPWVFIVLGVMAVAFAVEHGGMEMRNDMPVSSALKSRYIEASALTVILFLIVLTFDNAKNSLMRKLAEEKHRSDELLLNILPAETARELKSRGEADARLIGDATVLFTDFKGFTELSEKVTPKELVKDLHECFSQFDRICEKYGIEKIKTIGDAYMAAGGLPTPCDDHAQRVVRAALEMAAFIAERSQKSEQRMANSEQTSPPVSRPSSLQIRIGIHTGPVVAGIVGIKKFQYDIWGDTVNTASRMESSGEVGKVNISEATYALVKDDFTCEYRGEIEAKGKGRMGMYFVNG